MKLLIVTGSNIIFKALGQELCEAVGNSHEVEFIVEIGSPSPWNLLWTRIKKHGLLKATDQFLFKIFDLLVLRKRQEAAAKIRWNATTAFRSMPSLNSPEGLGYLRTGKFDAVICIASSIIGREALEILPDKFINIHPGVLPAYRGTGNLWAVVNKDWRNIGCTVHRMTEKIDVGDIVAIERLQQVPGDLWSIHVSALRAGLHSLAAIIRGEGLQRTAIDISGQPSCYYGWYGFMDYWRFRRALSNHR